MDKKAHEALERIRKRRDPYDIRYGEPGCSGVFQRTGRLGVCQWEAMLIDDEPEKQDDYEDR